MNFYSGIAAPVALASLFVGCTSTFETRRYAPSDESKIENGIAYYESRMVIVRSEFTQAIDKDGKFLGAADTGCVRAQKEEIQYLPDPSKRMVIVHHPTPFAASQLQVTFNPNGTLASVNAVSTPQTAQLLGTLETALKDKVIFNSLVAGTGLPLCNSTLVIKEVVPVTNFGQLAPAKTP